MRKYTSAVIALAGPTMNLRLLFHRAAIAASFLFALTCAARAAAVSLGIDELEKSNFAALQGKRVGLVTNPSGVDSKGRSAIDILYNGQGAGYHLVKLFGPEHGIDGQTKAGDPVSNSRDRKTHLPVYSLFITPDGNYRHPTHEMFEGLDAVVYDVQDLGNRSYTFISTLGYVMDEAAKDNVQVIVLDRPNPLGGVRIEGPRLDSSFKPSFVGLYDIPYVYGLTPGELAQWINAKYLPKPCRLTVIAMRGWIRPMVWEDTGLKWVPTSPNIPTIAAARGYTATGFLGEIGIESGCGTPKSFQIVENGRCNGDTFAERFNALHVPGVHAKPIGTAAFISRSIRATPATSPPSISRPSASSRTSPMISRRSAAPISTSATCSTKSPAPPASAASLSMAAPSVTSSTRGIPASPAGPLSASPISSTA